MYMKLDPKTKQAIITYFAQKQEVAAVYLYGSQARGDAKPDSDIDLAVLVVEKSRISPHIEYSSDLTKLTNKEVEIQDLKICNVDFAHRVLTEGLLLISNNEDERIAFEENTMRLYFDLKPGLDEYFEELSKIARRGELHVRYT